METNVHTSSSPSGLRPSPATVRNPNNDFNACKVPGRIMTNEMSEHGHDINMIAPLPKESGESVCVFFSGLFTTMIGLSTLGASITFTFVISPMSSAPGNTPLPQQSRYTVDQVQMFLAISFLLFLLTLAFTSLFTTLLTFFRSHWAEDWNGLHGKTSRRSVQHYAALAAGLIGTLTVAAFVFMCLVVIAFQPAVGWICLGFVALFGTMILGSILFQFPWPGRTRQQNVIIANKQNPPEEAV